jgi:hypothetical protein
LWCTESRLADRKSVLTAYFYFQEETEKQQ